MDLLHQGSRVLAGLDLPLITRAASLAWRTHVPLMSFRFYYSL